MRIQTPILLAALCLPGSGQADHVPPLPEAVQAVEIIPGWREEDGRHFAALAMELAPGWHTYWRQPGLAGIPPVFDWSGSGNVAGVALDWPLPSLFESFGIETIGYPGALLLPVVVRPDDPAAPIDLDLSLFFGVCEDICIPAEVHLHTELPASANGLGRDAIRAALATRALGPGEAGISRVDCTVEMAGTGTDLVAEVTFGLPPLSRQVAVLESAAPGHRVGTTEATLTGATLVARAPISSRDGPLVLDRSDLRLTLIDGYRMVDIPGCATGR